MSTSQDRRWFLEQVEREHESLRAFIRSMGVRAEEVDDLAQEVFLLIWAKLDEFDRDSPFDGLIRQIARHLLANERRKEWRRSRLLSDHITGLLLEAEELEENEPDSEQELTALRECMSKLPRASRELLHQRYFEELSPGAIGTLTGKSSNQIRQTLLRLRRSLLLCMKNRLRVALA